MIAPNRECLREVAHTVVDLGFIQKYGTALFNYHGEETEEYKNVRDQFMSTVSDCLHSLTVCQNFLKPPAVSDPHS